MHSKRVDEKKLDTLVQIEDLHKDKEIFLRGYLVKGSVKAIEKQNDMDNFMSFSGNILPCNSMDYYKAILTSQGEEYIVYMKPTALEIKELEKTQFHSLQIVKDKKTDKMHYLITKSVQ